MKVLIGNLTLDSGNVRVGETVRIGYYEQVGLKLTAEQEKQPVLKFVQEAVEKAVSPLEDRKTSTPKLVVTENANLGRRKMLAGKESSITVTMSDNVGSGTSAVSERDAMTLLSKFQFPSKRWYDRVGQLSGGGKINTVIYSILSLFLIESLYFN